MTLTPELQRTPVVRVDDRGNGGAPPSRWLLSQTSAPLKRSVIRELLQVIAAPDVISMAGGLPANELLPLDTFRQCLDDTLRQDGPKALQYGPPWAPLQEWIAGAMHARGVNCQPEQIFVTNGAQQGLAILSRLFLDPGDPVVIEAVTFTGIQQVTAGRGCQVITVPTDLATGVDVDALEAAFRRQPRPRLAILIPDFHNPLGVSLTPEKRRRVALLAATYEVPVVEDDPYSPLRFMGDVVPPIKAYDQAGYVFYLGSFSKMLAPALRLGWIVAPPELLPRITVLREAIDLESSAFIQRAVARFAQGGHLAAHLQQFNAANRIRRDTLIHSLEEQLGDIATFTRPEGGLFVWVTLPAGLDTWALLDEAVAHKVAYVPGAAFAVKGGYRNTMRLNFSSVRPDIIPDAVATLAQIIGASHTHI